LPNFFNANDQLQYQLMQGRTRGGGAMTFAVGALAQYISEAVQLQIIKLEIARECYLF
jgi:hypothetical protein